MRARRALALLVVVGLLAGEGGAARASSHAAAPHAAVKFGVFFKRSARLWHTIGTAGTGVNVPRSAVRALIAGPNAAENAAGVGTALPANTRLRSISVAGGVGTIDLNHAYASAAPRKSVRMRLAQLTYTATQFHSIQSVHLQIAGRDVSAIAGVSVPPRMTRANFARLVPAIVVLRPLIGRQIAPTVRVTGNSDVFEAAMVVKILNAAGHAIATKFFTASCGTGCRGTFAVTVSYHVNNAQAGTVVVTDTSATTGPPPHIVRIPVQLSP